MTSEWKFKRGDAVEWTSQAGGKARTKRGRVVARVGANEPVPSSLLVRGLSRIGAVVSRADRYVVRVARPSGKGEGLLYSPYRSVVEHAAEMREHISRVGVHANVAPGVQSDLTDEVRLSSIPPGGF